MWNGRRERRKLALYPLHRHAVGHDGRARLRYVTVHNGLYVELDWRIESGRFSGRDLKAFRARLRDIAITESVADRCAT